MTLHVFHILLALADQDRHGYGIIGEIGRHTNGGLQLGTGTLYTALGRLADAGWIEETAGRPAAGDDERRRYYRLTKVGRNALVSEIARLENAVDVARRKRVGRRRSQAGRKV